MKKVIKLFEIIAKIVQVVKTLVYVLITMLLLTALFGYSHLTGTVLSFVLIGILLCIWLLIVDFIFSPRQKAEGDKLPSRINAIEESDSRRMLIVILLVVCFLILTGFTLQMFF